MLNVFLCIIYGNNKYLCYLNIFIFSTLFYNFTHMLSREMLNRGFDQVERDNVHRLECVPLEFNYS